MSCRPGRRMPPAVVEEAEEVRVEALSRREFLARYEALRKAHAGSTENINSFNCTDCRHCANCMFCKGCETCYRCNYCEGCTDCSNCNQCRGCTNCHTCNHCVDCEACVGSAYLVLCSNCSDCSYCFGCVGLQKQDFSILNVPYPRTEYFRIVERLKRELGIRA